MKMYGGDWLTNAALVGYIRIQKSGGVNPVIKDGYVDITKEDLESFADRYFNMVLEQYMKNFFGLNKESRENVTKNLDEQKTIFKEKILEKFNKLSNQYSKPVKQIHTSFKQSSNIQVDTIRKYQKNLKKLLDDTEKEFGIDKKTITSVLKKNNLNIEKRIHDINEEDYKFIPNSLKGFYFNKVIVGNHAISKKSSRFSEFDNSYVKPASALLECDKPEGNFTCKFCKQNKITITSFDYKPTPKGMFSEGMFSSTMVSHDKFRNFFYNGQSDLFMCSVCELLFLCTWAGFNSIPLNARDDMVKTDKIFVHTSDLLTTLEQNDKIKQFYQKNDYSFRETIYKTVIKNILLQQQKIKSQWVLDSCFFIELKTVSKKDSGKPDFKYFHVGKNIAELFIDGYVTRAFEDLSKSSLTINNKIKTNLANMAIDRILSSKPLTDMCYTVCKNAIIKSNYLSKQLFYICLISTIRSETNEKSRSYSLNQNNHPDSKQVYGILKGLQKDGYLLASKLDMGKGNSNKSKSFSYVLLEAIRNNNMNKFFNILTKLYITNNMPVPDTMISMLNKKDIMPGAEKSYAFMSGFCSNVKETSDE